MTVQVFKGSGRQPWYVRLRASNGRILTTSEGYFSLFNAKRAARRMFPGEPIVITKGRRA